MILPSGAQSIIDTRKRGFKPALPVIVSLVGKTGETNPTVFANPSAAYDWRWIVGLQVYLYANSKTQWRTVAEAIATCKPANLWLWDVDRYQGADVYRLPTLDSIEKPQSQWRWKLDFLPWTQYQNEAVWS